MKASGCDLTWIGGRIKAARESLGLSQDGLALAVGGSKRGIQDNEARNRVPGGEVICGMVRLGINANWLLTGEGPMRIADLVDIGVARRNGELVSAFEDFWHSNEPDVRRELVAMDFQESYNAGHIKRIPGVASIQTSDVLAAYELIKPSPQRPQPPAEIDVDTLAVMIEGAIRARPNATPSQLARMAVDFYQRTQEMDAAKPEAA